MSDQIPMNGEPCQACGSPGDNLVWADDQTPPVPGDVIDCGFCWTSHVITEDGMRLATR